MGRSGCISQVVVAKAMFMGEYQHTIDGKGRLIIPTKFRDGLGEGFVVTKGLDSCLFVYPQDEWSQLEAKLRTLPFTNAEARAFVRFFFSGATEAELDKQGRVLIPPSLRSYGALEKDVMVIGVGARIEIWSRPIWEQYSQEAEQDYERIAEKIVDLDLKL